MIKTVPEHRVMDLLRMVSTGGAFAEAIFMAFSVAARNGLAKPKDNEEPKKSDAKEGGKEDVHQDEKAKTEGTNPGVKEDAKVDVQVEVPKDNGAKPEASTELTDGI